MPQQETIVIENTQRRLFGVAPYGFKLDIGENDVPKDQWERYAKTDECKIRLEKRWYKVRKDLAKATPFLDDISKFEEGKAIDLVTKCTNRAHLEKWKPREKRNKVLLAIQDRIAFLSVPMGAETEAEKKKS